MIDCAVAVKQMDERDSEYAILDFIQEIALMKVLSLLLNFCWPNIRTSCRASATTRTSSV